ncbi:MAG: Sapep family Mn(2+)-dependent dipeptidase [Angelakisella sp.]|nr:Sapep family Mn(2+)-dependent dipeptidase [Angelakisella sp.]
MVSHEITERIEQYIKDHHREIVEDLKTLVRIPSISREGEGGFPFGPNCAKVLDKAVEMAKNHGLESENHGNWYGTATYGSGDKLIGIFSHLDVVPEGNNWKYDPYNPIEKDGYLIGRGVADNKNAAVAGMYVMKCIKDLGIPLNSRISLYFGASEETGMKDIERFIAEQPMPDFSIVPDTDFPVCHGEKGIMNTYAECTTPFTDIKSFSGGLVTNMVADRAVAELNFVPALLDELSGMAERNARITVDKNQGCIVVTATGVSSHASRPKGSINAIWELAKFLRGSQLLAKSDRNIMSFITEVLADNYGEKIGIARSDDPSGKLTCICGVAETQNRFCKLHFDIRYPVTAEGADVRTAMAPCFEKNGWSFKLSHDSKPAYVPKDDPKVQELCRIYTEVTGKDSTPYVMGGGTYSRKLRNAIGFGMEDSSVNPFPAGHGGVHQPDEAMPIQGIYDAIKIYVLSVIEIDQLLHR